MSAFLVADSCFACVYFSAVRLIESCTVVRCACVCVSTLESVYVRTSRPWSRRRASLAQCVRVGMPPDVQSRRLNMKTELTLVL